MYFRDYVEEMMVNRLLSDRDKTTPEIDQQYLELSEKLKHTILGLARRRTILGFKEDDLVSFMYLKLHQVLRRKQYDFKRSPYYFFLFVFNNLLNDINTMKDRCLNRGYDKDALDDCLAFNNPLYEENRGEDNFGVRDSGG